MPQLPFEFLESLKEAPGLNLEAFVQTHLAEHKITSIRLNPFKPAELNLNCRNEVPWCSEACYLEDRPIFTLDPLFHAGCYYVQEAGSMFLGYVIKHLQQKEKLNAVLDVCAAPGGKSTLINSLIKDDALLVSNEIIKNRSLVLAQNLSKWGKSNTIVVNNDVSKLTCCVKLFDLVVVDAPCSGSGLFRKQPEAINEWDLNSPEACSIRQKDILQQLVPEMKNAAYLFYSTCSYSVAENESIVKWLIAEHNMAFVPLPIPQEWGIFSSDLGYRFYPDQLESEGFFCAVLQKVEGLDYSAPKKIIPSTQLLSKEEQNILSNLFPKHMGQIVKKNGFVYHFPPQVLNFVNQFDKQLYFKKAGICVGELKGKDLVPDHELSLAVDIVGAFEELEVTKEEALRYLRKETLLGKEPKKGFVKITYKSQGIGWAKLLPNRMNNYLPNEARILMQG